MAVSYRISIPSPESHTVEVELVCDQIAGGELVLAMPAWCPGSYLIRDYARHVRDLAAEADGRALAWAKQDKQTWRIDTSGAHRVRVSYRVYGHELSVRTNHIDSTHAFLHGPAVFLYAPAQRDAEVKVEIALPRDRHWRVATALRRDGDHYVAASIDELYDSPIHAGVAAMRELRAAGRPARLVVWGELDRGARRTLDDLAADLSSVMDDHAARFDAVPYDDYTFLLMLSPGAYGGLEHRNSSANLASPQALSADKSYQDLLELLSHEYFHLWNGKRMFPPAFERFDYAREAYTRCLWVVEGLTSYYDFYAVRRAGKTPVKRYFEKMAEEWGVMRATPGRRRQSLEESSFDAWIKLYKPDESNVNTTVSYYLKGGLTMAALDLHIRRRSGGTRTLDDVLRAMWREFGATGKPYPEQMQPVFEAACGLDLGEFFDRHVRGREDPDLAGELAWVGVELRETYDRQPGDGDEARCWLGVQTGSASGGVRITAVLDGGPADQAGISPGDEVVAIDGYRIGSDADLRQRLRPYAPGARAELSLFRRDRLLTVPAELAASPPNRVDIAVAASATEEEMRRRFEAWVGASLPESGVIAGATAKSWT